MNILHINTHANGGAAIAVQRLHQALLAEGVQSSCLYLHGHPVAEEYQYFLSKYLQNPWLKLFRKLKLYQTHSERNQRLIRQHNNSFDQFSFPATDYDIATHKAFISADIIHLHWVGDFLDFPSFFKKTTKPVIWTLHDKNPAMGGYHLLLDKTRKNNLQELNQELERKKYTAIQQKQNLHIVSPSQALKQFSKNSVVLSRFPHYHIPNNLPHQAFQPNSKSSLKDIFRIPKEKVHILALAFPTHVFHKGFDLLKKAIQSAPLQEVHFTFIGSDFQSEKGTNYQIIPKIRDFRLLQLWYGAADAFIISSREENLPNTMLEAMACGTPVIGFPVGGLKEVIQPGFNGLLAKEISAESLQDAIQEFIAKKTGFDQEAIRNFAYQHFAPQKVARQYIQLYQKVLHPHDD